MKRMMSLLLSLALLLTACGKTPTPDPAPASSSTAPEQSVSSETPPEEAPRYDLEGLTLTPDAPLAHDVQKVAQLSNDVHNDLGSFRLGGQYDLGNGKAVVVGNYGREDGTHTTILYSVDLATGEILNSKDMGGEFSMSYLRAGEGLLWYWKNPDVPTATALDCQLEEVKTAAIPWLGSASFAPDGSCWYIDEGMLKHDLLDGSEPESRTYDDLKLTYLGGVFSDGEHLYGQLNGDTKEEIYRELLVELDTNNVLFSQNAFDSPVQWTVSNGMLWSSGSTKIAAQNWKLVCSGGGTYSYLAPDLERLNVVWNNNGRVLFSAEDRDADGNRTLILWLYDAVNGLLEGMTRLPLAESDGGIRSSVLLYPDGSLLLTVDEADEEFTGSSACTLYRWYPEREHTNGVEPLHVDAGDFHYLPILAEKQNAAYWDPETYVPGPLSPDLKELKERANALGEKLGVNILLGDECHMLLNCYALEVNNDYDRIREALETLEQESAKYPEGFFRQVQEGYNEMDILLTGNIRGMEGYALDSAGGVATTVGDKMVFALNLDSGVAHTFHHELAHCIDRHINSDTTYTKLFDSEWNKLNPDDFCYLYSYVDNASEEMMQYDCFDDAGNAVYDAYFVDTYAMNYATEDRARLMENLMSDEPTVDLDKCPNLQKKLNYYAGCIRDRFDTTGWGAVRWEKYLKN